MKQRICYKWETADPSLTFLDEALNRLQSFEKPDLDESYVRSVHKVMNGGDFEKDDIEQVGRYLDVLAKRAYQEWGTGTSAAKAIPQMGESIRQAADNAKAVADHLKEIFDRAVFVLSRG